MCVCVCVCVCVCEIILMGWNPHGAHVLDWDNVVSKFKLQSCYYIDFQINMFEKGMNLIILSTHGLNHTTTVLLQGWF